ncbi:hypothetical protein [Stackebrandtia soli]|uniref:hypothetical protein n=1 Tax=Stackebrandtia soli TaxID=1892856 RepID=UPI0039E76E8A
MKDFEIYRMFGRLIGEITSRLSVEDAYLPKLHRRNGDTKQSLEALLAVVRERQTPITAGQRQAFNELCAAYELSSAGVGNLREIPEADPETVRDAARMARERLKERIDAMMDAWTAGFDEQHAQTLRNVVWAGDPAVGLYDLSASLAAKGIAMPAADRDELRDLLMTFGEPLDAWIKIPVG